MRRAMRAAWAVVLLAATPGEAQQKPGANPAVDQVRVDAAIRKGVEFLRSAGGVRAKKKGPAQMTTAELVLYTLVHAGVPQSDPWFRELLEAVMERPLTSTYSVALQAMVLEEVDRVAYQRRIWECAQFLVDNQCKNGQWSYGEPTTLPDEVPTPTAVRKSVATSGARPAGKTGSSVGEKPPVRARIAVVRRRDGPPKGDNSNSQYAALGLRACHDAGIVLPRDLIERAAEWWRSSQLPDDAKEKSPYAVRGWGYHDGDDRGAYGSMTAGAAGSLVICHYILGAPWMRDPAVQAGMNWLAANFSVTENRNAPAKHGQEYFHYYLYALERAGILYGTETLGRHAWYPEGAQVLLDSQKPDGSWRGEGEEAVWDTCFAILFLRRATRPLTDVASVDRFRK